MPRRQVRESPAAPRAPVGHPAAVAAPIARRRGAGGSGGRCAGIKSLSGVFFSESYVGSQQKQQKSIAGRPGTNPPLAGRWREAAPGRSACAILRTLHALPACRRHGQRIEMPARRAISVRCVGGCAVITLEVVSLLHHNNYSRRHGMQHKPNRRHRANGRRPRRRSGSRSRGAFRPRRL